MNLTTAINMIGGNVAEVVSLRTGEVIDISAGVANITEAVQITVPGVMEMVISPADVDIEEIEDSIWITIENIYKYRNSAMGIMETIATDYSSLELDAKNISSTLANPENLILLRDVLTKMG
jgi:hypothetical protein